MCSCSGWLGPVSLGSGLTSRQHRVPVVLTQRRHSFREPSTQRGLCRHVPTASDKDEPASGSDSTESLFMKELQKRGLTGSGDDDGGDRPTSTSTQQQQQQSKNKGPDSDKAPQPAPRTRSQLETSRALNSEGPEGLIPRVTQLGRLGLTFFLAFGPLILITAALFGGVYALFGDEFIHGGRTSSSIPYINPYDLLDEPTVDPTVPFK